MSTLALVLALATSGLLASPADVTSSRDAVVLHVADRADDYAAGHIAGAGFLLYDSFAVDGPDDLGAELPGVDVLRKVFEAAGVTDTSRVILYGAPLATTRAFFTLDYLGHANVRILNGGLAAWRAAGGAVETGPPVARPTAAGRFTPHPKPEVVALADWLVTRLESPAIALVDARPDPEYTGADGGMHGMHPAGHLAGARQLVWTDLVSRAGQFVPDDQLRAKLTAAGARSGVPVVSYCTVGMRASVVYFVARHLGYDARLYDGSITDWGRRHLPVKSGRP